MSAPKPAKPAKAKPAAAPAAAPAPAAAAPDPGLPELVYDQAGGDYWRATAAGVFVRTSERDLRRHLRILDWEPDILTPRFKVDRMDELVCRIQNEGSVDHVLALAGHRPGVFVTQDGRRILVPRAPALVAPKPGPIDAWEKFLSELLGDEQTPPVVSWLQCALVDLHQGNPMRWRHNQLLALAGAPRCGKSFFQLLITRLLGGRVADPYEWMTGGTHFNADLCEAEHLAMEDKASNRDSGSRQRFGAMVKQLAVSTTLTVHPKGRQAVLLPCYRRLTMSLNDDSDYITGLPVMDDSIADKVMLIRCRTAEMVDDWQENLSRFLRELPAFAYYLLHTWRNETPDERFGVATFHNEELLAMLREFEPHLKLAEMIDAHLWDGAAPKVPVRITSTELQSQLAGSQKWAAVTRQVLPYSTACGVMLERLHKLHPKRYQRTRSQGRTSWLILPPSDEN